MALLSYDIEIVETIEDGQEFDLTKITPSIAALAYSDDTDVSFYYDYPVMTKDTAETLITRLIDYTYAREYILYGWNILNFDLPLLAHYTGWYEECALLALDAVDPMFTLFCLKGHFLSLDKALLGAGLDSKIHTVTLNDGTVINDMSGKRAPELWRAGEINAVKEYLTGDVIKPLELAYAIRENSGIKWTSNKGKANFASMKLMRVRDSLKLPVPDNSWMENPVSREKFYSWIPKNILEEECNL